MIIRWCAHESLRWIARLVAAGLLACAAPALAAPGARPPADFAELMKEADLQLTLPPGFHEVPPPRNDLFDFDRAYVSSDANVEIRIAVRPIARMVIDYDDPHSSAPDPNDVHGLMFTAMIGQFARQGEMPSRDLPYALARKTFNADWAALAAFGADPALNTRHAEAMLLALHKNRTADVFVLFLYDDPQRTKPLLKRLMKIVRFRHATPEEVLERQRREAERARNAYLEEGVKAGAGPEQCVPPLDAKPVRKTARDLDRTPRK